jgi:hypothetical protein
VEARRGSDVWLLVVAVSVECTASEVDAAVLVSPEYSTLWAA